MIRSVMLWRSTTLTAIFVRKKRVRRIVSRVVSRAAVKKITHQDDGDTVRILTSMTTQSKKPRSKRCSNCPDPTQLWTEIDFFFFVILATTHDGGRMGYHGGVVPQFWSFVTVVARRREMITVRRHCLREERGKFNVAKVSRLGCCRSLCGGGCVCVFITRC